MMRTTSKLFVLILLLMVIFQNSHAQQLMVSLNPQTGQSLHINDLLNFNLTNLSGAAIELYAKVRLEDMNSKPVLEAVTNVFKANTGLNARINGIQFTTVNYPDQNYQGIILKGNGQLPPGNYNWSIVLYSKFNEELLSYNDEIISQLINPPILVDPPDKEELENINPLFTWLPPNPIPAGQVVNYTIRYVEILVGQQPITAIKANYPLYESKGFFQQQLPYTVLYPAFNPQKKYAWQVTAYIENTYVGESEIWEFSFKKEDKKKIMEKELNQSYTKLKKGRQQVFVVCLNKVRFGFEGDMDEGVKSFRILDEQHKELVYNNKEIELKKNANNMYFIDLSESDTFLDNKFYILEVVNEKGETLTLNFKYIRNIANPNY